MDLENFKLDLRGCNKWFQDRFPNKDMVSIEELIGDYEDLIDEVKYLNQELSDMERDRDENYTPLPPDPDPYERW